MKAHIVLAHPEPQSFNGHLAAVAGRTLEARGWQVTLTDLAAQGFDPCERLSHYLAPKRPQRFDAQSEQRQASANGTLPADVRAEIDHLDAADLVVLQYPMWWHQPPALMKGWMDRVFAYGEVYKSRVRFEHGRFAGKRAVLSLTVGTSPETYAYNGRSGDIDLMLWPVNFTLAYVGFSVLSAHVAYVVEAGLRYSDADVVARRLAAIELHWAERLQRIETEAPLRFNRMQDWGEDGRIKPDAPVYNAFVRHRETLEIE